MPTPTTLLAFATQEKAAATATLTALQTADAKKKADDALVAARAALQTAKATLTDKERNVTALRQQLPTIAAPPDGDELLAKLRTAITEQRAAQGAVATAAEAVDAADAEVKRIARSLAQASSRKVQAEALEGQAQAKGRQAADWQTQLGLPPLKTLKSDATAEKTTPRYTKVDDKTKLVPDKLLALAKQRMAIVRARRDQGVALAALLDQKLEDARESLTGMDAATAAARGVYDHAEAVLRDHVIGAADRLKKVRDLLDQALQAPDVSDAEKKALEALKATGEAAVDLETARNTEQLNLDAKQHDLDVATVGALATDVDADLATAVAAETKARDDAKKARDDKQTALDAKKADLAAWEAALPDSTWQMLLAFLDADHELDELAGTDPATLVTALATAENELVAALDTQGRTLRLAALLGDQAAGARQANQAADQGSAASRLGTIRGDR